MNSDDIDINYQNGFFLKICCCRTLFIPDDEVLELIKKIITKGLDINAYNDAIIVATRYNNNHIVKFLIANGANIYIGNNCILRIAVTNENTELVNLFLDLGMDMTRIPYECIAWSIQRKQWKILNLLLKYGFDFACLKSHTDNKPTEPVIDYLIENCDPKILIQILTN